MELCYHLRRENEALWPRLYNTQLNAWAAGIFYGSHCPKEYQAEVGEVTELAGVAPGWLQGDERQQMEDMWPQTF